MAAMGYGTTNPYTNEVVREFPYATDGEVDAALEAGHAAFQAWRTTLLAPASSPELPRRLSLHPAALSPFTPFRRPGRSPT
jgi:hypothetical protein